MPLLYEQRGVKAMKIRKTTMADLPQVMQIYADGRQIMAGSGNPNQWPDGHPRQEIVENDIADGKSYVCIVPIQNSTGCYLQPVEKILAVFYFDTDPDPNYAKIDGAWKNDEPYGVVHRIARAKCESAKGSGAFCLEWCYAQTKNVRIDTHKNNAPMLKLLANLGYEYCGTVWLEEIDEERMAFQK